MPKLSESAAEQTNGSHMGEELEKIIPTISITSTGMVTCGINRKLNTGNYENVDLYLALTMPLPAGGSLDDPETLRELVASAAQQGFAIASQEVNDRIQMLKTILKEGRQ